MTRRHATALETVSVTVPPEALEAYEAALGEACGTIGFFHDEEADLWTVEGVKDQGDREPELAAALALAALVTGVAAEVSRRPCRVRIMWMSAAAMSAVKITAVMRCTSARISRPLSPKNIHCDHQALG